MEEVNQRVVLLAGPGKSTVIVYNALRRDFAPRVILEGRNSRAQLLRRRIHRQGTVTVVGQLLFRALAVPALRLVSRRRLQDIHRQFGLDETPIPRAQVSYVESANSGEAIRLLRSVDPAVVVVNGTRVLTGEVLRSINAPFLNLHAGITPLYRGVHGGYWALANHDREHCGVTVHLVDEAIDTGAAVFQQAIAPEKHDNFVTYPLLQLGIGVPLLKEAVRQVLENRLEPRPFPAGGSRLWTHPTLWQYLRYRAQGVR